MSLRRTASSPASPMSPGSRSANRKGRCSAGPAGTSPDGVPESVQFQLPETCSFQLPLTAPNNRDAAEGVVHALSIAPVLAYLTRWAKGGQPRTGVEKGDVRIRAGSVSASRIGQRSDRSQFRRRLRIGRFPRSNASDAVLTRARARTALTRAVWTSKMRRHVA